MDWLPNSRLRLAPEVRYTARTGTWAVRPSPCAAAAPPVTTVSRVDRASSETLRAASYRARRYALRARVLACDEVDGVLREALLHILRQVDGFLGVAPLYPRMGTVQALIETGDLNLIRNDALRTEIIGYVWPRPDEEGGDGFHRSIGPPIIGGNPPAGRRRGATGSGHCS